MKSIEIESKNEWNKLKLSQKLIKLIENWSKIDQVNWNWIEKWLNQLKFNENLIKSIEIQSKIDWIKIEIESKLKKNIIKSIENN